MPTRLAVGLEAKKSSPDNQIRPCSAASKTLVPPCCASPHNFGNMFEHKFNENVNLKASKIYRLA